MLTVRITCIFYLLFTNFGPDVSVVDDDEEDEEQEVEVVHAGQ
jgi:hypothetical protein